MKKQIKKIQDAQLNLNSDKQQITFFRISIFQIFRYAYAKIFLLLHLSSHQENASQNHNERSPHTHQAGSNQKTPQKTTHANEGVELSEPVGAVDGNVKWGSHSRKQRGGSSK